MRRIRRQGHFLDELMDSQVQMFGPIVQGLGRSWGCLRARISPRRRGAGGRVVQGNMRMINGI